jgi:hypothetical protein
VANTALDNNRAAISFVFILILQSSFFKRRPRRNRFRWLRRQKAV